jgi:hypothetical protein
MYDPLHDVYHFLTISNYSFPIHSYDPVLVLMMTVCDDVDDDAFDGIGR